jgi:hypothetical protein
VIPGDVPALCESLRALIAASRTHVVVCDVGGLVADLVAVEALARLQLAARRRSCTLWLRHASPELDQLLELCGVRELLPGDRLGLNGRRQAEQREQPRRVEERVDPGDAPV